MTVTNAHVRTRKGTPQVSTETIVGRLPGKPTSLKGVLFGPPKTGKTTMACSGKNVLLISFDPDGDVTETLKDRTDITVVEPRSFSEIEKLIKALHTTDAARFNWVVVDSLTFLFQMLGGKELTEVFMANKDVRRAYGRAGAAVSSIIHDLVQLKDTNVIFTAHITKESDEEAISLDTRLGEHQVKLAVTPMVWKILGPAVSFIGRTYKKQELQVVNGKRNKVTAYVVSLNDGDRSPAGSRLDMPGELVNEPDALHHLAQTLL